MSAEAVRMPENMLDIALTYLADEWSVFPVCVPVPSHAGYCLQHGPCKHPGKMPLIKWGIYQDRLPTKHEVEQWWRYKFEGANIGLATGRTSDVVVVDLDGEVAAAEANRRGYDGGPWVRTGRIGGRHLYFRFREDAPTIFSKVGGIDFRGQGGFALLPPSLHHSGNRYEWGEHYARGEPLPSLPRWVDDLSTTNESGAERGPVDFGRLVIDGIPEGQRDQELFRAAAKLRGADVPYEFAVELIERAADACRPPFDRDEARAKVDSAYSRYTPNGPPPPRLLPTSAPQSSALAIPSEDWARPISAFLEQAEVEVDWLIDQLFSAGSSGFLAAEPKVGKSWIALDMAYCLSTGCTFLERFEVPQKRRVLFIEEEDAERRIIRRLKRLVRGNQSRGTPPDDYWKLVVRSGFRLDDREWIEKLRLELESFRPEVVFLDVFNKLHLKDENSQSEMSAILHDLAGLTRVYGCAFIIVHHYRKSSMGQSVRGNQMLRGTSALAGFAECSIFMRKATGKTIICEPESKDAPELEAFSIKLVDVENDGTQLQLVDGTEENISDLAQEVLDWMIAEDSSRTLYEMRLGMGKKLSTRSLERAKQSLAKDGLIVEDGKSGHATRWKVRKGAKSEFWRD